PGGRLPAPRPVALHLAPLLGGRRAGPAPEHRLDGPAARPRGLAGQPAPRRRARRPALARAGHGAPPGPGDRQARGPRLPDAPRGWGPAQALAARAFTKRGHALAGSRAPAVAQAARAAAFAGGVSNLLAPMGKDGKPTYTPQATYPRQRRPVPAPARGLRRDA